MSFLMLLLISASPRPSLCQSVAHLTQVAAVAKLRGVTEAQAHTAANEVTNPQARRTARVILWYVYTANNDNRVSPSKVAELAYGACMSTETNALTGASAP